MRPDLLSLILSCLMLVVLPGTEASEADVLYSGCMRMSLKTYAEQDAQSTVDISPDEIRDLVQPKLRAAGLFDYTEREQVLSVDISSAGNNFYIRGILHRYLRDAGFGREGIIMVWTDGFHGAHNGHRNYVIDRVHRLVEKFIVLYRSANDGDCG